MAKCQCKIFIFGEISRRLSIFVWFSEGLNNKENVPASGRNDRMSSYDSYTNTDKDVVGLCKRS